VKISDDSILRDTTLQSLLKSLDGGDASSLWIQC